MAGRVPLLPTDAKCDGLRATELLSMRGEHGYGAAGGVLQTARASRARGRLTLLRVLLHACVELEPQPLALKHEPQEP